MIEVRSVTIGDLGRVVTGKTPPSAQPELFGKAYPFLTPTDIDGHRRYIEPERFLSQEGHNYQYRLLLPPHAVCVVCIGATIGKMCLTNRPSFTNQQINSVVVSERHDPLFVYYLFGTLRDSLKANAGGAATPIINKTTFSGMEVKIPPLPIQRRIAGILSAYDELMENCQRRIRVLEEMARGLYREWFVHFRFPGYEKVRRVDSASGPTPEGWQVKRLFDLAEVKYGKNLPTKFLSDDRAYPVYGAAKIIGRHSEYTREQRTIICGCRGSVGEMQITLPQCFVTNNSFTFDPSHPDNFFWLFHNLRERGLRDVIGGAAQPQITLDGISSVELLTPPLPLRSRFQRTVAPMFEQAWALDRKVQNLRRTSDLLLPRLLSGQVSLYVSAVEDVAEPTVPAPPPSQKDFANEEPALRAAEETPPFRSSKRIS